VVGQVSKEVKVTSGVPQGNVTDTLLFLVYVTDIWRNIDSDIRPSLTTVIHRKITIKDDKEKLQKDLDTLWEWAIENGMEINPGKSKAIRFTKSRIKKSTGLLSW